MEVKLKVSLKKPVLRVTYSLFFFVFFCFFFLFICTVLPVGCVQAAVCLSFFWFFHYPSYFSPIFLFHCLEISAYIKEGLYFGVICFGLSGRINKLENINKGARTTSRKKTPTYTVTCQRERHDSDTYVYIYRALVYRIVSLLFSFLFLNYIASD